MSNAKKCPKCKGNMIQAGINTLGNYFGCTRNAENIKALNGKEIRSYICDECGYIEFYKKKKD